MENYFLYYTIYYAVDLGVVNPGVVNMGVTVGVNPGVTVVVNPGVNPGVTVVVNPGVVNPGVTVGVNPGVRVVVNPGVVILGVGVVIVTLAVELEFLLFNPHIYPHQNHHELFEFALVGLAVVGLGVGFILE